MFGRFRKKAPPPVRDERGWNEDWQVGDLARCINPFPDTAHNRGIARDTLLRVSGLSEGFASDGSRCLVSGLSFEGRPPHTYFHCLSFQKVRPSHDACDEEFAAELRESLTGEPVKVPA